MAATIVDLARWQEIVIGEHMDLIAYCNAIDRKLNRELIDRESVRADLERIRGGIRTLNEIAEDWKHHD